MIDKDVLIYGLIIIVIAFFLGWVFPVEGPIDYIYDKWASQPAIHQPEVKEHKMKCCPAPAPKTTRIYEDLNEDGEPEWYEVVPLFTVLEEE